MEPSNNIDMVKYLPTNDIRTLKWYSSCGVLRYMLIFLYIIALRTKHHR